VRNNWVLNPAFEADRISVSQPVGWSATASSNSEDGRTGRWSWNLNGNSSLSQTIVELPNATYELGVWVQSGGAGGELYIKDHGGAEMTLTIPASARV
jgi:hypothetical protein